MKFYPNLSDVRGISRLVLHRADQITDLVEEMHVAIGSPFDVDPDIRPGRTRGITGLVYRSIHGGYRLVDGGLDILLKQAAARLSPPASTPKREARLAAVNGVWGDYLVESGNPLAIEMALRQAGQPLALPDLALPQVSGKIALLVHGLCMNDLQWQRDGQDYGAELARDLGYTPIYVHYNSGLHISTNGRKMADLLEQLVAAWPQPVEELVIIAHSMGGLVARSACYYGSQAGHTWRQHLRKLIFLGTPHHGSPLERIGNWTETMLGGWVYTAPFRRLGMNRSAGITDLRYGNLVDEDWEGRDRFEPGPDNRRIVPLPDSVACYAIAATNGAREGDAKDRLLGDRLVLLDSSLGLHKDPERCLAFPPSQQWVGYRMSHMELLSHPEIYQKIKEWLG